MKRQRPVAGEKDGPAGGRGAGRREMAGDAAGAFESYALASFQTHCPLGHEGGKKLAKGCLASRVTRRYALLRVVVGLEERHDGNVLFGAGRWCGSCD
jgi:hypothetical protein